MTMFRKSTFPLSLTKKKKKIYKNTSPFIKLLPLIIKIIIIRNPLVLSFYANFTSNNLSFTWNIRGKCQVHSHLSFAQYTTESRVVSPYFPIVQKKKKILFPQNFRPPLNK